MRLIGLALGLSALFLDVRGGPTEPSDLSVLYPPSESVRVPSGWVGRGSRSHDLRYASRLCLAEVPWRIAGVCAVDAFVDETPRRRIWVTGFRIDRTEVSNAQWTRCMMAGRCSPNHLSDHSARLSASSQPVVAVTWQQAADYCRWAGGRLPSEAQWERAARGRSSHRFPWGNVYNPQLANHGRAGQRLSNYQGWGPDPGDGFWLSAPVGSFPAAASPFGVLDLAGNVWEWTRDGYRADFYQVSSRVDPVAAAAAERAVRGGSYRAPAYALRVSQRLGVPGGTPLPDVGFRCVHDLAAGPADASGPNSPGRL